MTRYFYDTEFLERPGRIDLISIGIIADDDREYYAININAPWQDIDAHPWLKANVVPHLELNTQTCRSPCMMAREVKAFLSLGESPPELWAWFGGYDHVLLSQLCGGIAAYPTSLPAWTNDVRQWQHQLGVTEVPQQAEGLHNALADARHCRDLWTFLARQAGVKVEKHE